MDYEALETGEIAGSLRVKPMAHLDNRLNSCNNVPSTFRLRDELGLSVLEIVDAASGWPLNQQAILPGKGSAPSFRCRFIGCNKPLPVINPEIMDLLPLNTIGEMVYRAIEQLKPGMLSTAEGYAVFIYEGKPTQPATSKASNRHVSRPNFVQPIHHRRRIWLCDIGGGDK